MCVFVLVCCGLRFLLRFLQIQLLRLLLLLSLEKHTHIIELVPICYLMFLLHVRINFFFSNSDVFSICLSFFLKISVKLRNILRVKKHMNTLQMIFSVCSCVRRRENRSVTFIFGDACVDKLSSINRHKIGIQKDR